MNIALHIVTAPFNSFRTLQIQRMINELKARHHTLISVFFSGLGVLHAGPMPLCFQPNSLDFQAFWHELAYEQVPLKLCSAAHSDHLGEQHFSEDFTLCGLATWLADCQNADQVTQL